MVALCCYARARRCPALTSCMVLSAYARAMLYTTTPTHLLSEVRYSDSVWSYDTGEVLRADLYDGTSAAVLR
eukprot:263118-Rhodomonas_salina.1